MTFIDLQTKVKRRVIDLPPPVLTEIPDLINEAIRSAQRRYNFRAMEASQLMTTTVGSLAPTPNVIANFKEYKDKGPYMLRHLIRAKRELLTTEEDAALATLDDINNPSEPIILANSINLATSAWTFTLHPYPDNISDWDDGNYRIVVPYYQFSAKLVADSDFNWFTENMDDYIVREAAGQAFMMDWDYQSGALWLQEADKKFNEAKKTDKMTRLGGVDALVPMWEGANQPQVRR